MSKVHVRVATIEEKMYQYVEDHPVEIYIDYNDELSEEQVTMLLEGRKDDCLMDIEDWANNTTYEGQYEEYWEEMGVELNITKEDVEDWLSTGDGIYPSYYLDDHGWRQLLRNTNAKIEGVMWDTNFNMNNWAYGYPVTYSDVKDTLKLFGINPKDFHDNVKGGSMTSGEGKLKGWFPDMPDRVPKIKLNDIFDGMCSLYDGVVVFALGDLENVAEVLGDDPKNITIRKGTNVVIYEFAGGAGITDFPLIEDIVIPRKQIDFRTSGKYGLQDCYGFTNSYWQEGSIS